MAVLAAGCATPPPCSCPPIPAPPPVARYEPVAFDALPGWRDAPAAASLQAFLTGCARASNGEPMRAACDIARSLPAGDDAAARAFFEDSFAAYAIVTNRLRSWALALVSGGALMWWGVSTFDALTAPVLASSLPMAVERIGVGTALWAGAAVVGIAAFELFAAVRSAAFGDPAPTA